MALVSSALSRRRSAPVTVGFLPPEEPLGPLPSPTIYVSASGGSSTGTGSTSSTPVTWARAMSIAVAGSCVALLPGNYASLADWTKSGTAANPIVIRRAPGATWGQVYLYTSGTTFNSEVLGINASYVDVHGLAIRGDHSTTWSGTGLDVTTWDNRGIALLGPHPGQRIFNMMITRTGAAGVVVHNNGGTGASDYFTIYGVLTTRFGYRNGWASGIVVDTSVNTNTSDAGFHSFIDSCISSGGYDNSGNNSDGNGFINDPKGYAGANQLPWILFSNLIAFNNGGKGLNGVPGGTTRPELNTAYVNCTVVHNNLATDMNGYASAAECQVSNTEIQNMLFLNCLTKPRDGGQAYKLQNNTGDKIKTALKYGTSLRTDTPIPTGSTIFTSDPKLKVYPPQVTGAGLTGGSYWAAENAWDIADDFVPQSGSGALGTGSNPLPELPNQSLRDSASPWLSRDIRGRARSLTGTVDVGAYQVS